MAIAKTYEKGDTVFVAYPFPSNNYFAAQSRVVDTVNVNDTGNEAEVTFDDGVPVQDSDAAPTIYSTAALASAAIVTDVIAQSAAAVVLDATLSVASTGSQASVTLGRVD